MNQPLAILVVGWAALLVTTAAAVLVGANPARGLAVLTHRPEFLPRVMVGRYAAQAFLVLLALWMADAGFLLALMLAFVLISFWDAALYARAGHRFGPHLLAGLASMAGALLLLIAEG